ncbi:glycosyl transferase [Desulfonema ishimotonii]|uniref:Glycosyl transferase n=1 Tax=Desulfonema ishimotonii TaxID=45657 RepID=A0A401G1T8_9BACT|nr:glycosyltransferase [Desulfonema ishimotonii]GBC63208.1 glycosyl transferase [Desulfonema ishimotonii]
MKIIHYCQHVLGLGHFFRTLEICRALSDHNVTLVTGGAEVDARLPDHVREIRLPGLMMDSGFRQMFSTEAGQSVDMVKERRRGILRRIFEQEQPDLFIVELYPFGRKAFRFELDPILADIRSHELPPCRVVCSLRDILVEKKDTDAWEKRVLSILNRHFDALLIHADPALLSLDRTFSRMSDIAVPVAYTGFVTPEPPPDARRALRLRLGLRDDTPLVVASAGGGKVGAPLLKAVAEAFPRMGNGARLQIFTGPFMADDDVAALARSAGDGIHVARFTPDFLSWLAAADLSVSMAGYNTCMNLMAAAVPSLVWPFARNREQRLRAEHLSRFGGLRLLRDAELEPSRLCDLMAHSLDRNERPAPRIDLNGAAHTAEWLETWMAGGAEKAF